MLIFHIFLNKHSSLSQDHEGVCFCCSKVLLLL
uniref:Uncharacterized protein n=1 Tax=Rhizophora mucronata TaxID=61149 RepID=A0A2P2P7J9_RHIMU